ncbi:MAG: hypothetical protein OEM91_12695, partial [Hyphomicrobiales bacterium]|nr:hypothetical protein [Hyphomicrobiales bacterium]
AGSAYAREESRGSHFRSDFPKRTPASARRSILTLDDLDAICASAAEARYAPDNVIHATFGS